MLGGTVDLEILEIDVGVVGAGAAGLALVQTLAPTGARVVILENGGRRTDLASDALNESEDELELRASRARVLGGTTTLRAGQCIPFDAETSPLDRGCPTSGWPVRRDELERFHREVERLMAIAGATYKAARPEPFRSAYHHMGTTRMSDDPRHGVVDRHGQVHGVPGLYVAGASVFPTSSWADPTFTAMALAVRLARRLAELGPRPHLSVAHTEAVGRR